MIRSMIKVAAGVAIFGGIHSALASRTAKKLAADMLGERNRNGLYRVFFNVQSVATVAALSVYILKQPSRVVYRVRGPLAVLMHAGQIAALGYGALAAHQIGFLRISGLTNLVAWLRTGPVSPEPEAQGPALDPEGMTRGMSVFAWSRHPLNFIGLPILWLWPKMTTNLLACNLAATVYLIIGSQHEEARLQEAYGDKFTDYKASGIPFFLPFMGARDRLRRYVTSYGDVDCRSGVALAPRDREDI